MSDSPGSRDLHDEPPDLRGRLMAFLGEQDVSLGENGGWENASLIRSGLLDSLALFQLSLWIEREAGRPYDLTAVDLSREWDSVSAIVGFVEALKARPAPDR